MSFANRKRCALVCGALSCLLTVLVFAASAPVADLQVLDEVVVSARKDLPLADFVKFPKYESVAISPGGTRLAAAWTDADYQLQVALFEFPSMKSISSHSMTSEYSASEVAWASERRLLITPQWPLRGLMRVRDRIGVIMTSDLDGGNPHTVNREAFSTRDPLDMQRRDAEALAAAARPYDPERASQARNAMGPVRMVATRSQQADKLLFQTIAANDRGGNTESSGAYLLDLKNHRQTRVATLPLTGGNFITGPGQRVALVTGVNAANESYVYYLAEARRDEGRDWRLVASTQGTRGLRPVAWAGTGEEYYALDARDTPTRSVVIWDAATGNQRLLYRHAGVDMDDASLDPAGRPWMFSGSEHFPVYWYPDPEHPLARLHRSVVQKIPDEQVEITNASDDLSAAVLRVSSGRRPPVFLVVNVKSASEMASMFSYPTLRGTRLAQVEPIEFRARDGVVLRGFLTTPEDAGGKARKGLPLVVIAHNGPLGQPAGTAYEFERQLFASRGYAVLQVNTRGTSGRGTAYERAGDGRWGREVQDDYIDGVRWAIKDGVAGEGRVCFYGIGYGAFSAMTAAARDPAAFRCVIGVGGVYDLPLLLGEGRKPVPAPLQQVLGNDMADLKARSPVSMASAIQAKVLLMPQDRDEFFPVEQSQRMRAALRSAGNAAQWEMLGQQHDGHHVPETRAASYGRILRFLEQQIGK